jgi:hypothetical protein
LTFIERIIFRVLSEGLQWYVEDPARFEDFIYQGLITEDSDAAELAAAADEASRARAQFEERAPEIIHGYARVDGVFPCWAIVLGGESTDTDYLGEDAFDTYLDNPEDDELERQWRLDADGNRADPHSRRWGHNFEVYTYVDHPDTCLYYYYLAKQVLAEGRSNFQARDLDEITYTGADLAPDPRYLPSGMFVRKLAMKMSSDQVYFERNRPGVGAGKTIGGAHVAEDDDDATGVDSNISVYTE